MVDNVGSSLIAATQTGLKLKIVGPVPALGKRNECGKKLCSEKMSVVPKLIL